MSILTRHIENHVHVSARGFFFWCLGILAISLVRT